MKRVVVVYPGRFQDVVDPDLFNLAKDLEGEVLGSGMMMFGEFERDIDFSFPNGEGAKEFVRRAEILRACSNIPKSSWSCEAYD